MARLLITVHGIRTFGNWQERLEALVRGSVPDITVRNFKYGYFGLMALLFPLTRYLAKRHFARELASELASTKWERVDIISHSFGTSLTAYALLKLDPVLLRPLHLAVLASSPLPSR